MRLAKIDPLRRDNKPKVVNQMGPVRPHIKTTKTNRGMIWSLDDIKPEMTAYMEYHNIKNKRSVSNIATADFGLLPATFKSKLDKAGIPYVRSDRAPKSPEVKAALYKIAKAEIEKGASITKAARIARIPKDTLSRWLRERS